MGLAAAIPSLLLSVPLLAVVLCAAIAASVKREELGRAASLVMVGASIVLLTIVSGMAVTVLTVSGTLSMDGGLSTVLMLRAGFSTCAAPLGWGLILLAVFVDRQPIQPEGV